MCKCPKCHIPMDEINYRGVTIDKCNKCEGVWLDKGEESFVTEILAQSNQAFCGNCSYYKSNEGKCVLLKFYVKRDFSCANFVKN